MSIKTSKCKCNPSRLAYTSLVRKVQCMAILIAGAFWFVLLMLMWSE